MTYERERPARPSRHECEHTRAHLAVAGASNGVGLWCPECEEWATKALTGHAGQSLPKHHPRLSGIDRETLPRVRTIVVQCAICEQDTDRPEIHHWCPQATYRDAGTAMAHDGPTADLCPMCHAEWHRLVTPMLGGHMSRQRALGLLRSWYRRWSAAEWQAFVASVNEADAAVRRMPPRREAA